MHSLPSAGYRHIFAQPGGLAIVDEMAVMVVSENWIPYESIYEKMLVDALATLWRRSVKGLRYGLPGEQADRRRAAAGRAKSCRALHRATGCRCDLRERPARAYWRAARNAKLGLATG